MVWIEPVSKESKKLARKPVSKESKKHRLDSSVTASIAQLVERPLLEREVVGSNHAAAPYQRCKNGTSSSLADARIKKGLC